MSGREKQGQARRTPPAPPGARVPAFDALRFRHPLRKYQQMILAIVEGQAGKDEKYHLVAPPGAGKTIVGLELIRRFGRPAVVLAPTTTIQQQWREKLALFIGDPAWIEQHSSVDPARLAEINILTYQSLSTPGENLAFAERISVQRWIEDLLSSGQADTEAGARQRIATLATANPQAYRREVGRRYGRVKREFLQRRELDGRQFLHAHARDLIERIVALGTGTLVLDECHHLLDYWAFILRELVRALPGVRIVGLTATLPDPANQDEYENYTALLGDVDFEVPTPAVVREGNLSPYRDLAYFCEPSPAEEEYLREIQAHFETALRSVTGTAAFRRWLWGVVLPGTGAEAVAGPPAVAPERMSAAFERAFREAPLLCIAAVKVLLSGAQPLPYQVPLIPEMLEPVRVDDWLILLETFGLRVLKPSADARLQALYRDLSDALLPFGITISEQGIRHTRSPGDLVLALSESKDAAAVAILKAELEAMGRRLRAVVITDYERISARSRRLKGVLDPDAGSALRVFRCLVGDPATCALNPVMVSGKLVLAGKGYCDALGEAIGGWQAGRRLAFAWEWRPTEDENVVRLAGSGRDWSSRTYVALLTALFEQGVTRCLVGTRGIFGEGWDALGLNTLIDLTAVTTSTGVQQIRGRTIRLDPDWPRKVAHNWDVVCYSRRFDKGDSDLARFVARHAHTWGLLVGSTRGDLAGAVRQRMAATGGASPGPPVRTPGRVVRGLAHVDAELAVELASRDFKHINFGRYTRQMLAATRDRDRVYELWGVGRPYDNQVYSSTRVEREDVKFRTAYTVRESLRAMAWRLLVSVLAVAGGVWLNAALLVPWADIGSMPGLALALSAVTALAALATVAWNLRGAWRVFRRAFLSLPADAVLLDMGRALLAALRDAGSVSPNLGSDFVRVVEAESCSLEVFLDYASAEDSVAFSAAYRQMMGDLGDARYLIERDSTSLRNLIYRPLWRLVRQALGLRDDLVAYHRVPDVLAARRPSAEALARHWQRYVGGGRLIYTRTEEGRRILLEARARQPRRVRQAAFETWR